MDCGPARARAGFSLAPDLVNRHARGDSKPSPAPPHGSQRDLGPLGPPLGAGRAIPQRGHRHDVIRRGRACVRSATSTPSAVEVPSPPSIVVRRSAARPPDTASLSLIGLVPPFVKPARTLKSVSATRSAGMTPQTVTPHHPRPTQPLGQRLAQGHAARSAGDSSSRRRKILDYVVVHELAHLRWGGHGARFWSLVRRQCAGGRSSPPLAQAERGATAPRARLRRTAWVHRPDG
jgi:hypothetical protein